MKHKKNKKRDDLLIIIFMIFLTGVILSFAFVAIFKQTRLSYSPLQYDCGDVNIICIGTEVPYTPGMELNEAGKTYVLTQDITDTGWYENGFDINGSDITLDCDGHSIISSNVYYKNGIEVLAGPHIIVKNCNIQKFNYGIFVLDAQNGINNEFLDNTIIDNERYGILIGDSSPNSIVSNNIISGSTIRQARYAIGVMYAHSSTVSNNLIENNCGGISVIGSDNVVVSNNNVFNNRQEPGQCVTYSGGIVLDNVKIANVFDNELSNNNASNIYLNSVTDSSFSGNIISESQVSGHGIFLYRSNVNNVFENNRINGVRSGVYLDDIGSTNSVFNNNEICYNMDYDFWCDQGVTASGSGNVLDSLVDDLHGGVYQNNCSGVGYNSCPEPPPEEPVCGNGILEQGEECDCGSPWNCTFDELGNKNCSDLDTFSGGDLGCYGSGSTNECKFNTTNCISGDGDQDGDGVRCGDGIVSYRRGEYCDINSNDFSHCYSSQEYLRNQSLRDLEPIGCQKIDNNCNCKWSLSIDENSAVYYLYGNCYCPEGQECLDGIGVSDKLRTLVNLSTNQTISSVVVGNVSCVLEEPGLEKVWLFTDNIILPIILIALVLAFFIVMYILMKRKRGS